MQSSTFPHNLSRQVGAIGKSSCQTRGHEISKFCFHAMLYQIGHTEFFHLNHLHPKLKFKRRKKFPGEKMLGLTDCRDSIFSSVESNPNTPVIDIKTTVTQYWNCYLRLVEIIIINNKDLNYISMYKYYKISYFIRCYTRNVFSRHVSSFLSSEETDTGKY